MDHIWYSSWWWLFDGTEWTIGITWFALVIGVLVVEWRRRKQNLPQPSADPTCPTCGYLVIGLAGKVCPECGSDLASVGVLRRDDHRTSPAARVILWTILFALPAFLVWRDAKLRLPILYESTVTQTFSGPLSGAYRSMEVRTIGRRWHWRGRMPVLMHTRHEFRLQRKDNSQPLFVIERPPLTWAELSAYLNQFGTAESPRDYPRIQDRRPLLEWMRTQGVDTSDIAVQAEADFIGVALDERLIGFYSGRFVPSPFASNAVVQTGYQGRPWWLYAGCAAIALVIWLIGARLFAKRRSLPYERTAVPPLSGRSSPPSPDTSPTPPGAVIGR
jgi:hypothetical protein